MTTRISQPQLESYLWGAATLLRGTIDAGEYKSFIFPLLFLKRLSDVYDEEYAAALEESEGDKRYAELPEQHRFQIPAGAHWDDVRNAASNVGHPSSRKPTPRPTTCAVPCCARTLASRWDDSSEHQGVAWLGKPDSESSARSPT